MQNEKSSIRLRFSFSIFWTKENNELTVCKGKGKGRYSSSWEELRDVTCHMGSHSVTCHPTQVNATRLTPAMQAGT